MRGSFGHASALSGRMGGLADVPSSPMNITEGESCGSWLQFDVSPCIWPERDHTHKFLPSQRRGLSLILLLFNIPSEAWLRNPRTLRMAI